jgi:hypothetical protein
MRVVYSFLAPWLALAGGQGCHGVPEPVWYSFSGHGRRAGRHAAVGLRREGVRLGCQRLRRFEGRQCERWLDAR